MCGWLVDNVGGKQKLGKVVGQVKVEAEGFILGSCWTPKRGEKVRSVFSPNQGEWLCARMCGGTLFTRCSISAMLCSVLGRWILVPERMCVASVTWSGEVLDAWFYVGILSKLNCSGPCSSQVLTVICSI